MGWNFTEWRRFVGGGTVAGIVLVVSGILVSTVPWNKKTEDTFYLTTRDYLEVIGAFAERETAFAVTTNFVPLQDSWWHGSFKTKSGYKTIPPAGTVWDGAEYTTESFTTNAASMHYWLPFPPRESFFPFGYCPRMWVNLSLGALISAAGSYSNTANDHNLFDVDHAYCLNSSWWATNVWDGRNNDGDWPGRYTENGTDYAKRYVDRESLCAVTSAMSACHYQLSHGHNIGFPRSDLKWWSAYGGYIFEGTGPPDWDDWPELSGLESKSWGELLQDAYDAMVADLPSYDDASWDWAHQACVYMRYFVNFESNTSSNQWWEHVDDGRVYHDYRLQYRKVSVGLQWKTKPIYDFVCGNNVIVYALARPSRIDTETDFYHPDFGTTEPVVLQSERCDLIPESGNIYRVINSVLAYHAPVQSVYAGLLGDIDGFPPDVPGPGDPNENEIGGADCGWQQRDGQYGFWLEWNFDFLNDHPW